MSSKNNVNPGQYKTRGSLRQGEDVVHDIQKKAFTQAPAPDTQDEVENMLPASQPADSVNNKVKAEQKQTKRSHSGR